MWHHSNTIVMETYIQNHPWVIALIACLGIIDYGLKVYAMWYAARSRQTGWFVCLAIFNTIGILPLIYLNRFKKGEQAV